ncbi:MAG: hypothetical protein HYV02_00595 [Deltaproteobacteria bacterium]|nr:hypothetical protein [Deltaproteobacteria bacterium]
MSTVLSLKQPDDFSSDEGKGVKAGPDRILIPDAEYDAQAVNYKVGPFKNTTKIYLKLKIVTPGPCFEGQIWIPYQEYKQRYPAGSNFYKAWVIAHGRKPAGRKIKPDDLCGKIYRIKTRTVEEDQDRDPYPPELQYSVAKIIGLVQDNHASCITGYQSPTTNYRLPTTPSISGKRKKRGEVGK